MVKNREQFLADLEAVCVKHGTTLSKSAGWLSFVVPPPQRYTQEQMHEAFTAVQSPKGWKYNIDKTVYLDEDGINLTSEAITHFAGGGATFTAVRGPAVDGKTKYRVRAPGYYTLIGA